MDHMNNDDVRWLSAHEQRIWRDYLAATAMLGAHLEQRLQETAGLPHAYYAVLAHLSESPDATLRMSALAELAHFSRSRLSHAVSKMESAGLVERRSCPTDRRGALVTLTDKGMRTIEDAAPDHVTQVRSSLFDVLDAEQVEQLGKITRAIIDKLTPECEKAAGELDAARPG